MTEVLNLRKVQGIVPIELQNRIMASNYNATQLVEDLEQKASPETQETEQGKKFVLVSKIKEVVEKAKEKKENKIFDKIRDQMVCAAFGIGSVKELESYRNDYEDIKQAKSESELEDSLERSKALYDGQVKAGINSKKEARKKALDGMVKIGVAVLAITNPAMKLLYDGVKSALGYVVATTIGGLIIYKIKGKKAKRTKNAEMLEKCGAYYNHLQDFMKESGSFSEVITQDKEQILAKQKELKGEEFNNWYQQYIKSTLDKIRGVEKTEETAI